MPSGDEIRVEFATGLRGEVGVVDSPKDDPLDILLDALFESAELKLEDLPWLIIRSGDSVPVLEGTAMAFADCPLPTG